MLFLVPTPIGNLQDITLRALNTLKEVDLIFCEDTRKSRHLLNHYEIKKPLKSWHKFNESKQLKEALCLLESGKKIALITDAGTPGISDPGAKLVRECRLKKISVTALPGPTAPICALSLSGFDCPQFQFIGFLPKTQKLLKQTLLSIQSYPGITLCFEAPHRLLTTLALLKDLFPKTLIGVAKELTKTFEAFFSGYPHELLSLFESHPPKGEFVLLFQESKKIISINELELSISEHVQFLIENLHISKQEAIKTAALLRGVPKRFIYNNLVKTLPEN